MYPLSEAANPKPTRFVDGRSYPLHTLPFYDIRALQDIHDIVSVEPVRPRDKVMMGMLATIGIELAEGAKGIFLAFQITTGYVVEKETLRPASHSIRRRS
jgi:hypothetical protein